MKNLEIYWDFLWKNLEEFILLAIGLITLLTYSIFINCYDFSHLY